MIRLDIETCIHTGRGAGVARTAPHQPSLHHFPSPLLLLHATPWTAKQRPAVRPLASQWPPSAVCMAKCTALVPHQSSRRRHPPIGQQFMAFPSYHRSRQRAAIASPHASHSPTNLARLVCAIPSCRASRSGADGQGPLPPAPPDSLALLQVLRTPSTQYWSIPVLPDPAKHTHGAANWSASCCLSLFLNPIFFFGPDTSLNRDKPGRGEPLLQHPSTPTFSQPTPCRLVDHNHGTPLPGRLAAPDYSPT